MACNSVEQLAFGYRRGSELRHLHSFDVAPNRQAHCLRSHIWQYWYREDTASSSEQFAFVGRAVVPIGHEIVRYACLRDEFEKTLPRFRPARQDDVSGRWILTDVDRRAFEPKIGRQADGLTPAILEKPGDSGHHTYSSPAAASSISAASFSSTKPTRTICSSASFQRFCSRASRTPGKVLTP